MSCNKKRKIVPTYSANAFETIGNKIAQQTNVLHFVQLWGEQSLVCKRALDLQDLVSELHLPRIKHTYVKPSMFGFESEEGQIDWISYKGFIENVVNKEGVGGGRSQGKQCVEHYKAVVAYLIREGGLSKDLFDSKYVYFGSFQTTFRKLYASIDPEFRAFEKDILDFKREIQIMEDSLKTLVYNDIVNQIERLGLLNDAPKHFDMDQCCSMEKMNPFIFTSRQKIDLSALGEDIKSEIHKKFSS